MDIEEATTNGDSKSSINDKKSKEPTITINDFTLLCVIGKGSYAKVILVRKKDTKEILALKVLKKKYIQQRNQVDHVQTERYILANVTHPFIIKMKYAFQNERKLYFALEYCSGGELFNLLQKRRTLTEDQARFYAAQIVLAIEHLHSLDIIYRDLKPENVLLDNEGYIRLTDFGLSKKNITGNKGATSICGTPEYLAPELLFKVGHGKAADWWTLGAILYEMLTGLPAFYTPNRDELFQRIKYGMLVYPSNFSPSAKNLLDGLFKKDPERRLGGGPNDAEDIKKHPWFEGIDWGAVLRREYKPPFVPKTKSEIDVSNFDVEFTKTSIDSLKETGMLEQISSPGSYPDWSFNDGSVKSRLSEEERKDDMEAEFELNYD